VRPQLGADLGREGFLTAFQFGPEMRAHLAESGGSERDFSGPTFAPFVWWDVDRDDPQEALRDARRLAGAILARYPALDDDELLLFLSGSKGYHLGFPTSLMGATGGPDFHAQSRAFALALAALAEVGVDESIYSRTRLFRAPNSTHPRTRLRKRRLVVEELQGLTVEGIRRLAVEPLPFDPPDPPALDAVAAADWARAVEAAQAEGKAKGEARQALQTNGPRLTRSTLEYLRDGAGTGDRHRLLYSAAANMGEFGSVEALAFALLEPVGLDTGLPPREVRRQIECGLRRGQAQRPGGPTLPPAPPLPPGHREGKADG
jgi:hypothetical protein